MKGIVFTEFMELVEQQFGMDTLDDIIEAANLPNDGAYTATGTYDHQEIVQLVMLLSQKTGVAVPELLHAFGKFLFGRFAQNYGVFFDGISDARTFLSRIEGVIHVEVRKLYPGAELPRFEHRTLDDGSFQIDYFSARHFEDLAHGLIEGCCEHFNEAGTLDRDPIEDGTRFTLRAA